MGRILEVIVTCLQEAREAEAGGADRLELVRDLVDGGLTPPVRLVEEVLESVRIPVRVMIREHASMLAGSPSDVRKLRRSAAELSRLRVDGLVLGFIKEERIDLEATRYVLDAVDVPGTFHRAFDEVADPEQAIADLKSLAQVDRILTGGGPGAWLERRARLGRWAEQSRPDIEILVAAGLCPDVLAELPLDTSDFEFHVGRAARNPHEVWGAIDRRYVAALKNGHR